MPNFIPYEKPIPIGTFANMLGISPRTLQRWDKDGILKAHRGPTNRRYYTESQVAEALQHISYRIEQVGEIYVDTGECWIGDPCHLFDDEEGKADTARLGENWQAFCRTMEQAADTHGVISFDGMGIVIPTGMGDGIYPVFATFNKDGRVTEVIVQFLNEDEDGEEEG